LEEVLDNKLGMKPYLPKN